jgi:glyoxylase-like metal-dependent hydrolase (beta-lactamase superfamily II)
LFAGGKKRHAPFWKYQDLRRKGEAMSQQIPVDPAAVADNQQHDAARDDGTNEIAPDLAYKRCAIANVVFYGLPGAGDRQWILIDAGVMGTTGLITGAAEERFGPNSRPAAIVMTHGHFDHVGALEELAERWQAPVYAHELELPYLDGRASYPPPDPTASSGLMSLLSPLYPRGPVNVSRWLQTFPNDGSVPVMPGWSWLHTPGHTPGHVSLWREADRSLIVGDAFITTAQESAYAVATQRPEMHGPPMYFTQNWQQSRTSVERLAALEPELAVTGHGPAMRGAEMRGTLQLLARDFDRLAVPEHGRYVEDPTHAETGTAYVPSGSS